MAVQLVGAGAPALSTVERTSELLTAIGAAMWATDAYFCPALVNQLGAEQIVLREVQLRTTLRTRSVISPFWSTSSCTSEIAGGNNDLGIWGR